jgi:hypothetical protein
MKFIQLEIKLYSESMKGYLKDQTIEDFKTLINNINDESHSLYRKTLVDPIACLLIASANNNEFFYDISIWGKSNNTVSIATLSRRKESLHKLGIIEEEHIKMLFGRPRILLKLNNVKLKELYNINITSMYCRAIRYSITT